MTFSPPTLRPSTAPAGDVAQSTGLSDAVLVQWFGSVRPDNASALAHKAQWFTKSAAFDAQLKQRFGAAVQSALDGQLRHWATQGPWPCLALILLLDQFTRNIHRGTPQSFAGDPQALALALEAQDRGWDLELPEVVRSFMYLPLEHAEDPAIQQRSVQAVHSLVQMAPDDYSREFLAGTLDYAYRHQEVIARFGRFPHRNPILGRASTPAESEYLAQPGSGF